MTKYQELLYAGRQSTIGAEHWAESSAHSRLARRILAEIAGDVDDIWQLNRLYNYKGEWEILWVP